MSAWASLLTPAMVGTDRHPRWASGLHGDVAALAKEAGDLSSDAATRLLREAAVIAVCSSAGAKGSVPAAEFQASPVDRVPALDAADALRLVTWSVKEGPHRLQHLVLARIAAAGWRLPTPLLPFALDLGRRSIALRRPVRAAVGVRGAWLAQHNAEWRYATAEDTSDTDDESMWSHGTPEQRATLIAKQRARDASAARDRVATELPTLPAAERRDLLATLAHGLSYADEELVSAQLRDRSKEVRLAAAGLLLRLPDSAFVQRATHRVEPLVREERALLRTRWTVEAPANADPGWEDDAIDPVRPKQESLGERAWWLYQLVRQVPLDWWCRRTGMSPAELLKWATKTDWSQALLRGWRDVLMHTAQASCEPWCEALLDGWPWEGLVEDPARIVALLPLQRRERHWDKQLSGKDAFGVVASQILAACPPDELLSLSLSRRLATEIREALGRPNIAFDYAVRNALPDLCCVLDPEALRVLDGLLPRGDETPAHAEALHTVERVVAARRALIQLPSSPVSQ